MPSHAQASDIIWNKSYIVLIIWNKSYIVLYMKARDIIVSISVQALHNFDHVTAHFQCKGICSVDLVVALLLAKVSKADGRKEEKAHLQARASY